MEYIAHFFWQHFPHVETEVRTIDGKAEVCLILPTRINQIKKGKRGDWLSVLRLCPRPINEKMITHDLQLSYLSKEEAEKAIEQGYYKRTQRLGRVRERDCTPSKKIDRQNLSTDLKCDGVIVLSDIPKSLIRRSKSNNRLYLCGLVFRPYTSRNVIYTGSICIDDIPRDEIKIDTRTGKKFVKVRFCKLESLDTYMNTHQLIVVTNDGSEIEIGRFKEWTKDGEPVMNPPVANPPKPRPVPSDITIDGYKF